MNSSAENVIFDPCILKPISSKLGLLGGVIQLFLVSAWDFSAVQIGHVSDWKGPVEVIR